MHPVSIFIMDVSKSSTAVAGEEISSYLSIIEGWVKAWFDGDRPIQIKHRSGDELIFLAEGYSSAFVTAFFISRLWKYEANKPYFGLAFGKIDKKVTDIDIEKWIHPLVKLARNANDSLKKQKERETFYYQVNEHESELMTLLNGTLKLQHALNLQQTEIQRLVCSLYLIYGKQNTVAELLSRSAPTIYSHFKKGHSELVLGSYHQIAAVLDSLEAKEFENSPTGPANVLEGKIRDYLKVHVPKIFEAERGKEQG